MRTCDHELSNTQANVKQNRLLKHVKPLATRRLQRDIGRQPSMCGMWKPCGVSGGDNRGFHFVFWSQQCCVLLQKIVPARKQSPQ